jgi:hypothetical protein
MPSQKRERQSRLETVKTAKSIGTGPYNVNDEKNQNAEDDHYRAYTSETKGECRVILSWSTKETGTWHIAGCGQAQLFVSCLPIATM